MKNGKSPGNDSFTKEFYVAFFGELGPLLLKMCNYSFGKGELSASQKQAVITLIQKKDRDVMLIKNWRPISLINVDIKIASKALATRMKTVIHSLISYDQTAHVKGRYIGEFVCLIDDLLKYAEDENIDRILFAADIEKAFDSVDHDFMFAALKRFGFGNDFVRWIKTIFKKSQSCVMNNGTSTGYFNVERETRQGDPLSPYLFILALETLFIQIRSDPSIKGFWIKHIEIKLSAYADDTTFFVKESQSLQRILKLMKEFQVFSSLTINVKKCEASWIGRAKNRTSKPVKCKWTSLTKSCIKILGIHFSYNKALAGKENCHNLSLDCRTLLNIWKQRWLSLAGKIQVFKSLVASKPVYVATMISVPKKFCDTLKSLHREFIWNGKRAKIKHSSLIGKYRDGGLKDVDVDAKILSLKISWIRKLKDSSFHPWKVLANHLLSKFGGETIFHANLSISEKFRQRMNDLSLFYRELVLAWEKFSVSKNPTGS